MSDTNSGTNTNTNNSQDNHNAPKLLQMSGQPPLVSTNNPNNSNNLSNNSINNPANPKNNIVRNWLSAIAGVLVVLIAITYMVHRNDNLTLASGTGTSTVMTATTTTTVMTDISASSFMMLPNTMMTASQDETVTANNQLAGRTVAVRSMTLSRLSWVAVMAKNGSILGAGLFPKGSTSGTIPLQRATIAGMTYKVVIYADNGDKTFELHQDLLVMNSDKSPVGTVFMAQ
jgi:hypothetical protein